MRPGDMAQVEREIIEAEKSALREMSLMWLAILCGNFASFCIGLFFAYLIWGI